MTNRQVHLEVDEDAALSALKQFLIRRWSTQIILQLQRRAAVAANDELEPMERGDASSNLHSVFYRPSKGH